MQFMLTVHGSVGPDDPYGAYGSEEEMNEALNATAAFNDKLEAEGRLLFVAGLVPASEAVVVDGRSAEASRSEGPYLSGPERIGGFWVIKASDREEAVAIAQEASAACRNAIEVRALAGV